MNDTTQEWEERFKARVIKPEEWTPHEEKITELYKTHKLSNVRRIMALKHDFYANETQYKKKIRKMKFSKQSYGVNQTKGYCVVKNLPKSKAEYIIRKEAERLAQGKKTTFLYHGKPIDDNMEVFKKRYKSLVQNMVYLQNLIPVATPSDIEYLTPKDPTSPDHELQLTGYTPIEIHESGSPCYIYNNKETTDVMDLSLSQVCDGESLGPIHTRSSLESQLQNMEEESLIDVEELITQANNFRANYKLDDAYRLFRQILLHREKILGIENPSVLATLNDIGNVLSLQGNLSRALEVFARALYGLVNHLENEIELAFDVITNIAQVFSDQGEWDDALEWHKVAYTASEQLLGAGCLCTRRNLYEAAGVFLQQDKIDEALVYFRQVIDRYEMDYKNPVKEDLLSLFAERKISICLLEKGHVHEPISKLLHTLYRMQQKIGYDRPETLTIIGEIGWYMCKKSPFQAQGMGYMQRALQGFEKVLGRDDPHTLVVVRNIGTIKLRQGEYRGGMECFHRIAQSEKPEEHPFSAGTTPLDMIKSISDWPDPVVSSSIIHISKSTCE